MALLSWLWAGGGKSDVIVLGTLEEGCLIVGVIIVVSVTGKGRGWVGMGRRESLEFWEGMSVGEVYVREYFSLVLPVCLGVKGMANYY